MLLTHAQILAAFCGYIRGRTYCDWPIGWHILRVRTHLLSPFLPNLLKVCGSHICGWWWTQRHCEGRLDWLEWFAKILAV